VFDAFEVLGIEPLLSIDEDLLRQRYQQLSKTRHPDANGSEAAFRELNEAYELLRSPSARLRHWLAIGGVEGDPRGAIGGDLLALFGTVGEALQHADGFLKRREAARTALSKALLEREATLRREQIQCAQAQVDGLIAQQIECFARIDSDGQQMAAEEAWTLSRNLQFLEKWRGQLRERFGALF
jgi:curved DNA-binding protein CbpA